MDNSFVETRVPDKALRLPVEGNLDLTYRCNNNCLHCWLRIPPDAREKKNELPLNEIKKLIDDARAMGCRRWSISGGEPMLRPDFPDIFDYITACCTFYSLNTNGSLITPKIARLLKRKGGKMIALYGATADVHDHITRNPGSFELTMRGFRYLKEVGAGFTVQLIPMKGNYHQYEKMVDLAKSLSRHYRVGAAWLYLSACGAASKNQEIAKQRLPPREVVALDNPDLSYEELAQEESSVCHKTGKEDHLLASCIRSKNSFHVDASGKMSFCCFVKDPVLRYDLRKGSFSEAWDKFIPSLARKIKITKTYKKNCGSCASRKDCRWCPVYGFLEHGRYDGKVEHLCAVAAQNKKFKENWLENHRRYFKIADMTIQVESDLPFKSDTFDPKFKHFETSGPGKDTIRLRHHFSLPELNKNFGKEIYRKSPWAIYKKGESWIYLGISTVPADGNGNLHRVVTFNSDHTRSRIYNDKADVFSKGNVHALTLFPTDQILVARLLADRKACFLHSAGVILKGNGLLFVGHSSAGKSTMCKMLKGKAEILCDDRNIVRWKPGGFRVYGTWSHGEIPEVSGNSAPLRAIYFLKKSLKNEATLLKDKKVITAKLLACLIKPFVTPDWWDKTLSVVEKIAQEVPCYVLEFDKSGKVLAQLKKATLR